MLSIISPSIINPKDIPAYELYTSECDELYFEQGVIYNEAKVEYHDELINPHVVECTVVEIFGKEINDMIVMFPEVSNSSGLSKVFCSCEPWQAVHRIVSIPIRHAHKIFFISFILLVVLLFCTAFSYPFVPLLETPSMIFSRKIRKSTTSGIEITTTAAIMAGIFSRPNPFSRIS